MKLADIEDVEDLDILQNKAIFHNDYYLGGYVILFVACIAILIYSLNK